MFMLRQVLKPKGRPQWLSRAPFLYIAICNVRYFIMTKYMSQTGPYSGSVTSIFLLALERTLFLRFMCPAYLCRLWVG